MVRLGEPLESVFGRQNHCRGRILGLHLLVGDSLTSKYFGSLPYLVSTYPFYNEKVQTT